jgi:hypothetical protein
LHKGLRFLIKATSGEQLPLDSAGGPMPKKAEHDLLGRIN